MPSSARSFSRITVFLGQIVSKFLEDLAELSPSFKKLPMLVDQLTLWDEDQDLFSFTTQDGWAKKMKTNRPFGNVFSVKTLQII